MKITTKITVIAASSITTVLAIGLVLTLVSRYGERESKEAGIADEIVRDMAELGSLTSEYALYKNDRTKRQWRIKYNQIAGHLQEERFEYPEERVAIGQIRTDYDAIGALFSGIVQNRERKLTGKKEAAIALEQEFMLVNSLLIKSHSIVNRSFEMAKVIHEEGERFHEIIHLLIMLSMTIIAAGMMAISIVLARGVVMPITKLHKGTEIIGSGNLDFKVGTDAKDEIGQLSRAFDLMTANLRNITASRDELNREIAERKLVEEALMRSNKELEQRINEIKTLRGLLPICSYCKKIRDDKGYWQQIESYIHEHSQVEFSHGMCPACAEKAFKELEELKKRRKEG
ncbi:MAG: HAMP domain-containing protein [Nitrospirae bacterium]|nr:HAMP domain-containing protein [Nitrospirota bacterium]